MHRKWTIMTSLTLISLVFSCRITTGGEESLSAGRKGEEGLKSIAGGMERTRKDRVIVVLGASYAKGLTEIPMEGITVINKGVGGEQSSEMLARFKRDVESEEHTSELQSRLHLV